MPDRRILLAAIFRKPPLALARAEGKTAAEIDDFFRMCAGIE